MAARARELSLLRRGACAPALALVAALLGAGCSSSRGSDGGFNPVRQLMETSEDQERELGMQFDREVGRHIELVDDPVVLAFVHDLGNELLKRVPSQPFVYRFRVVKDPTLNAFAVPGGYIYLHSGTILAAGSVDELAGVLAHEIGHVKGRHYARMREKAAIPELLTSLAGVAVAAAAQQPGAAVIASGANVALQLHFSREFENEADQLGMDYMTRSGYEPAGMGRFFERIVAEQKKMETLPFQVPPYLYSHPEVEDRIVSVETTRMRPQRPPDPSFAYRLREVQARLAILSDMQRAGFKSAVPPKPAESEAAIAEARALAAVERIDEAVARLEAAERLVPEDPRLPYRRADILEQAGRRTEAIAALRRTLDLDPQPAMALYRLGLAYRDLGDRRTAIFYLDQAARRFGEGSDLQERAWFEVEKLTFRPFERSGLADGSEAKGRDVAAGFARDRFTLADEKVVWWGELHPRYRDRREELHARWLDPAGTVLHEEPLVDLSKPVLASELPLRGMAAQRGGLDTGTWTVEVRFGNDVVDRKTFLLAE